VLLYSIFVSNSSKYVMTMLSVTALITYYALNVMKQLAMLLYNVPLLSQIVLYNDTGRLLLRYAAYYISQTTIKLHVEKEHIFYTTR